MDREDMTQEELEIQELMRLVDAPPGEAISPQPDEVDGNPSAEPETEVLEEQKKTSFQKNVAMYLHDLVILMSAVVLVFLLCFRIVIVSGDSMFDTLVDGDYLLLLSNVFYQEPRHGDIIVASKDTYDNGTPIVKRVIATEGQTVDIDFQAGIVYVDGQALKEDYIYTPTKTPEGVRFPLVVDEGCVFVLGDNRALSKDSRNPEIGLIDCREIVGKAIFLLFPGNDGGTVNTDLDRIGGIG